MAVPWLQILDAVIGVTDLARSRKIRRMADAPQQQLEAGGRVPANLEARLAGVVVAALKEAFDRDTRRLQLEREQLNAERERAERALRLELLRQAGDREIGRLRLLAGVAVASWIGTLFFSSHLIGGGISARVLLGSGWLLLLAAFASALTAQSKVADALATLARDEGLGSSRSTLSGAAGTLAVWLIVGGLSLIGAAVLLGP
jgi:hypothetical protein